MMRRAAALALAVALVGGLLAIPGSPAGAQNGGSMLDVPRLGFEIDPKAGYAGDTVAAQVNPVDVQEHCVTEVSEVSAWFFDSEHPDANGGFVFRTPGPVFADYMAYGPLVGIEPPADGVWPVIDSFPGIIPPSIQSPSPAWVDPLYWAWSLTSLQGSALVPYEPWAKDTLERAAAGFLFYFIAALLGPPGVGGAQGEAKQGLLEASTIVTFVDPVTQELVGEMGGFDPDTGVGQVDVPDLDPGLWAVAAACVEPVVTEESFLAAISAGADSLAEIGIDLPANATPAVWLNADHWPTVAAAMLTELMQPRALGIDFYCIVQPDGFCVTPPDAVGLLAELTDEELAEFADLDAGDGAGDGAGGAGDAGAEVVVASPAFTG